MSGLRKDHPIFYRGCSRSQLRDYIRVWAALSTWILYTKMRSQIRVRVPSLVIIALRRWWSPERIIDFLDIYRREVQCVEIVMRQRLVLYTRQAILCLLQRIVKYKIKCHIIFKKASWWYGESSFLKDGKKPIKIK